jgi:hypothetical protein
VVIVSAVTGRIAVAVMAGNGNSERAVTDRIGTAVTAGIATAVTAGNGNSERSDESYSYSSDDW